MMFLPVCIEVSRRNILVVGGGRVALRKIELLENFTTNITVLSPKISKEIKSKNISFIEKKYSKKMLKNFFLVYVCTNDRKLNRQIKTDTQKVNIMTNVVDDPVESDFISPAIFKHENMSVAVSSGGQNVKKAIDWRNKLKKFLKNDKTSY